MRCPTLSELPPPPPGKTGWPWTEESPQLPDTMPDGSPWPRVSVVTPSYNQGQFLEETIRSVLLQGYPDLEYIIIDGGSTDGSVEIIRKYEPWLAYWVSEPDRGQAHAINKGFRRATGEILAWLNADDLYTPEALRTVEEAFRSDSQANLVYGACQFISEQGEPLKTRVPPAFEVQRLLQKNYLLQPAIFFHRSLWERAGPLNEQLHYSLDYDLWLRFGLLGIWPLRISRILARYRLHRYSKTVSQDCAFYAEDLQTLRGFFLQAPRQWRRFRNQAFAHVVWRVLYEHMREGALDKGVICLARLAGREASDHVVQLLTLGFQDQQDQRLESQALRELQDLCEGVRQRFKLPVKPAWSAEAVSYVLLRLAHIAAQRGLLREARAWLVRALRTSLRTATYRLAWRLMLLQVIGPRRFQKLQRLRVRLR